MLVPTSQFVRTLVAARLAADVCGVPTVLVARTDALSATLLTSDVDERDREFVTGERTPEGFYRVKPGIEAPIARSLAYAPYADVLWFETSTPDMDEARRFAEAIHAEYPGKYLAYNCSPSFNWRKHLSDAEIERFQRELGELGYRYQFITLAGFHSLNEAMFELAKGYAAEGMPAYVELQEREFALEADGYTATRHQREAGAGYFDAVMDAVSGGRELDPGAQGLHGRGPVRDRRARGDDGRRGRRSRRRRDPDAGGARLRRAAPARARPAPPRAARAARRSGSASSTRAHGRTSCPRRGTSATATGRWPRPRPTCRTAASRSPARSTAR